MNKNDRLDRLERIVEELAQSHKELAQSHKELEKLVKDVTTAVGKITDTVGYGLEIVATAFLPSYIKQHFGIKTKTFAREFFNVDGKEIEMNLMSEGKKKEKNYYIFVECKSTIYPADIKKFHQKIISVEKILNKRILNQKHIKHVDIVVAYFVHPRAYFTAENYGIHIITPIPHRLRL